MTKNRLFGTDGVRGLANVPPIDPQTTLKLAMAAAVVLGQGNHRHRVVISKDTRESGYMLETAMTAGFNSMGFDVLLVGPLPTPAVSMLVRTMRADVGVMISASHNPFHDNGIKFFDKNGHKLSNEKENSIETLMAQDNENSCLIEMSSPSKIGWARRYEDARGRYIEFLKNTLDPSHTLDGLKVVVDCAHGASYRIAPMLFMELGAEVSAIGNNPNGVNINAECGAIAPLLLAKTVQQQQAHIGVAMDGDADRVVIIDNQGMAVAGEYLLAAIAQDMFKKGQLKGPVVSTILANMGLEKWLNQQGIKFLRVGVGDRNITHAMREHGCNLGGEPSGHIILGHHHPTGDGMLAALQLLSMLKSASPTPAHSLFHLFPMTPQRTVNITARGGSQKILNNAEITHKIETIKTTLAANNGRVIVRPSGTEPLIRVMVECEDQTILDQTITQIISILQPSAQKQQP